MEHRARKLLAQKLRILRMTHGWSQERLAAASGLHRTYISLVERSVCNISLDNLEKIADAFGVSLPDLLRVPDPAALGKEMLRAFGPAAKRKGR